MQFFSSSWSLPQLELQLNFPDKFASPSEAIKGLAKIYLKDKKQGGIEKWQANLNESCDNLVRHVSSPDGGFGKFDKMFGFKNRDMAITMAHNQIIALYQVGKINGWM